MTANSWAYLLKPLPLEILPTVGRLAVEVKGVVILADCCVVTTCGDVDGGGYLSCDCVRFNPRLLMLLLLLLPLPLLPLELLRPLEAAANDNATAAAAAADDAADGVAVVFDCCCNSANCACKNCGEYCKAATAAAAAAVAAALLWALLRSRLLLLLLLLLVA